MGRYEVKLNEKENVVNKIRTRVVSTTPYNVYNLRSRKRRRMSNSVASPTSYRTETAPFEDVSINSITHEVIVSNFDLPQDSCCSSNITASFLSHSVNQVESGGETSSKVADCDKISSAIETNKLGREGIDGVDHPATKSTVQIKPMMMMMPSRSEIDDFFSCAEKDLHQRFSDKYNFDVVKDEPLEGRYEWVGFK